MGLSLGLSACGASTFRDVHTASDLAPGERLLFGEVIAEGAPLSEYAIGVYLGTEVVFDRALPRQELSAGEMDSLPDWQDREQAPAALQKRWETFATALQHHEDGHRQIAIDHANGLRTALTQLAPGTSCDTVQEAADRLHGDWSERMSAAQTEYDRVTRHGITQGTVF